MAISPAKRSKLQHLVNVTTKWELSKDAKLEDNLEFELVNEGVTDLTEDLNPDTDDLQYVAEDEKTHVVKTYAPAITLSAVMIDAKEDPVNGWIQKVINKLPKGDEADTAYIRFNLLDDKATQSEKDNNKYKYEAYRRMAVVEASSIGGAAGDNVEMEVTISGKGEAKKGILTIDKSGAKPKYTFEETDTSNKSVEFTVTNKTGGAAIDDASVEFNGTVRNTDNAGKTKFDVPADGTYMFTVAKNGFESVTSNKTIAANSDKNIQIAVGLTSNGSTYSLRD